MTIKEGRRTLLSRFSIFGLLFFGLLGSTGAVRAAVYYVASNGSDSNPGTESQPWTLAKANATLLAGDTVHIKAGNYGTGIIPARSGTAGNPITYRNFNTDVVTISGPNYGVSIDGKSYITVQGINVTDCTHQLYITNGAHHNIIAYCNFYKQKNAGDWETSVIHGNSQYNWIHHTSMSEGGECSAGGSDDGSVLEIGTESSSTDQTQYNLIEESVLFHGGHHIVGLYGRFNTIRNNYFHNEAWSRSKGNRTLYMNGTDPGTGTNLIEGNHFGYAAAPCDAQTVGNVPISTPYNIFRYNTLYHHNAYGLGFADYTNSAADSAGSFNKIYNNTIFHSGYNIDPGFVTSNENAAVTFPYSTTVQNRFHNNLYFANRKVYGGSPASLQVFANEFDGDTQGNPLFVNASATAIPDPFDSSLPNLNLSGGSPAINQGGALTTVAAADSGSGTSLVVANAGYFQDGTFAPAGAIQADWIAVGTVGNVVQISSINQASNTITLTSAISRNDNDPVWLYKKSDGVRVLYGSAPDAGAYEYTGISDSMPPAPPTGLKVKP